MGYDGSIKEDWEVLKPKEISDPEDKKPDDWVEEKRIVDSDAKKPDDWDDEEDGEWEAPMKDNPDYKGEWMGKRISNPAYKGFWEAKKIANPEYVDDNSLYSYDDFGFVGLDLWQVKGGSIFDKIIITDDVAEADKFAAKWKALNEKEQEEKKKADEASKPADDKKDDKSADDDDDDDDEDEKKE